MAKRIDRENITPQWLKAHIDYDPATGALSWRKRYDLGRDCARWNARYAGKPALASRKRGHLYGCIGGRSFFAHRVAWAIFHSTWPSGQIDHINGDRSDNSIKNLRVVTSSENNKNRKIPVNNTSGIMGVARDYECPNKWRASIRKRGMTRIIGRFFCLGQAIKARRQEENSLEYHPNHGRRC